MPRVEHSALVDYSASQMYALVNDVEQYPAFVPGCGNARVVEQSEEHMVASMEIAKAGVRKWFTTRNRLSSGRSIELMLVDGPFRSLHGLWRFEPDGTRCRVSLSLQFEFANPLLALAMGGVFQHMVGNMVAAFARRAEEVYGV